MKMHASCREKRGLRCAVAAIVMAIGLCPFPALAFDIPIPLIEQDCPVAAETGVAAVGGVLSIDEGRPSKLDEMKAQQAGLALPAVQPIAARPIEVPAPAAGPALAAPCTASAFTPSPASALLPDTARRTRAAGWLARLMAVSIARRPALHPALALPPVDVSKPDIFGSVALAIGRTPFDSKWRRAHAAGLGRAGPWKTIVGEARALDQGGKIELINRWVNRRVHFTDDVVRFKVADRWATAIETLRAGRGDCEDYAIAKLKLLEAAGVAHSDMFLVIARDLVRRADHALLVVRKGDRLVVLDNNTDSIIDAAAIQDYRPVMSYSSGKAWLHGYADPPAAIAQTPVRIAALAR